MPKYFTRVELMNAEVGDYEKLDLEFKKQSFVKGKGHTTSALRAKEYYKEGNVRLQFVTASVYEVAKRIGKKFSFTVMRDKGYYPIAEKMT